VRSAWIAERLIGCFTGKQRASAAVGDLVEMRPEKGALWFWIGILGILFSLTWRRSVGFVAALFVGTRLLGVFEMRLFGIHTEHRPPEYPWMPVFLILSAAGVVLCMMLVYSAIRYGLRDKLTQLVLVWAGLITLFIYEWWRPVVLVTCIALAVVVTATSVIKSDRRKALLAIWVPVACVFASWWPATYVEYRYEQLFRRGPWGDVELRAHPSVLWVVLIMYVLMVCIATVAFSRMRRWASKQELIESQTSPSSAQTSE
jgi:hypothetical protein